MRSLLCLSWLYVNFFTTAALAQEPQATATIDSGNTTWVLISAALVMLMTPGLAFFYAGMVNRKNVVSTLLQNYASLAIVGLLWVTVSYSLAFSAGNSWIGSFDFFMLKGIGTEAYGDTNIPHYAFMAFQMMFAAITPALITGAVAERVHFKGWILFMTLWSLCVYVPVCHWVWGPEGWIAADGGLDFAGGLVVHVTAGVAGLVAALVYGRRIDAEEINRPNDISMIMLGAALLWFGWFGFNAGSALGANALAAHAFVTTYIGAASAFLAWMLVDWIRHKRPSAVGAAIGLVVGLVTITPAAGFVSVQSAMIMCAASAVICNVFTHWFKTKIRLDDALDVFACHGMGGIMGAIMTGLFAETAVNPAVTVEGLFISGELELLRANVMAVLVVAVFTVIVTYALLRLVNFLTPIRVTEEAEKVGLDTSLHGEVSRFHDRRSYK